MRAIRQEPKSADDRDDIICLKADLLVFPGGNVLRDTKFLTARAKPAVLILMAAFLAVPFLAAGCGASTPEAAVEEFYGAIESRDWNAYLNSVLPENVRRMTQSDSIEEKQRFEEADYKYTGLKFKATYDKKNKDRAEVELTDGKISGTNPMTNETETTTIKEIKETYDITPSISVQKFKGSWYVVVPMASEDKQQQQPQQ